MNVGQLPIYVAYIPHESWLNRLWACPEMGGALNHLC